MGCKNTIPYFPHFVNIRQHILEFTLLILGIEGEENCKFCSCLPFGVAYYCPPLPACGRQGGGGTGKREFSRGGRLGNREVSQEQIPFATAEVDSY